MTTENNDNESTGTSLPSMAADVDQNWISWFCSLAGNQYFCEVDKSFIIDSFNLFGLKAIIGNDYNSSLELILDKLVPSETSIEDVSRSSALLYGLIHARYIITSIGLEAMHRKYLRKEFGECPRAYCRGQPVLPVGFSDEPRHSSVKLFCPLCQEAYNTSPSFRHIDGAYFGTSFPHLFFMTYSDLCPSPGSPLEKYTPRVFGFKLYYNRVFNSLYSDSSCQQQQEIDNTKIKSTCNISQQVVNILESSSLENHQEQSNTQSLVPTLQELQVAQLMVTDSISSPVIHKTLSPTLSIPDSSSAKRLKT